MRLECQLGVMRSNILGLPMIEQKSVLSISKDPRFGEPCLVISNRKDPMAYRYFNLRTNLSHMHTKFMQSGRATVVMTTPDHTLYISKADPNALKEFLIALNNIKKSERPIDSRLFSEAPTTTANLLNKPNKSLIVKERSQLIPQAFHRKLEIVSITGIWLAAIPKRVFMLESLVELCLDDNVIEDVPETLGHLRLKKLSLSKNHIRRLPEEIFDSNLGESLYYLNLADNELEYLPPSTTDLKEIKVLIVKNNKLKHLPYHIIGADHIQLFDISNNCLKYMTQACMLPYGRIAISNNPMDGLPHKYAYVESRLPSLFTLAACYVLRSKKRVNPTDVPLQVYRLLKRRTNRCVECWKPVFVERMRLGMLYGRHFARGGVEYDQRDMSRYRLYGGICPLDVMCNKRHVNHFSTNLNPEGLIPHYAPIFDL